jgi:hypothetical protein
MVSGTDFYMEWSTSSGGGALRLRLDATCGAASGQHIFQRGRTGTENTSWRRLDPMVAAPGTALTPMTTPAWPSAASMPPALCDISGRWQMNTTNVGTSQWTFTRRPDGYYHGQEAGLGNATGTAMVSGSIFYLEWVTGSGAGNVRLSLDPTCSVGNGQHAFTQGRAGAENTTWRRLATF